MSPATAAAIAKAGHRPLKLVSMRDIDNPNPDAIELVDYDVETGQRCYSVPVWCSRCDVRAVAYATIGGTPTRQTSDRGNNDFYVEGDYVEDVERPSCKRCRSYTWLPSEAEILADAKAEDAR